LEISTEIGTIIALVIERTKKNQEMIIQKGVRVAGAVVAHIVVVDVGQKIKIKINLLNW